jgi:hypothetical protein
MYIFQKSKAKGKVFLVLKHHARRTDGGMGVNVKLNTFLTSALDGGGWSA